MYVFNDAIKVQISILIFWTTCTLNIEVWSNRSLFWSFLRLNKYFVNDFHSELRIYGFYSVALGVSFLFKIFFVPTNIIKIVMVITLKPQISTQGKKQKQSKKNVFFLLHFETNLKLLNSTYCKEDKHICDDASKCEKRKKIDLKRWIQKKMSFQPSPSTTSIHYSKNYYLYKSWWPGLKMSSTDHLRNW